MTCVLWSLVCCLRLLGEFEGWVLLWLSVSMKMALMSSNLDSSSFHTMPQPGGGKESVR